MKARITELEGTDTEIASALVTIISARTPQLEAPQPAAIDAEVVEDETPVFGVQAATAHSRLVDVIDDVVGEPIPRPYPDAPHWTEIPVDRRWWGRGMQTLHIRNIDDPDRTMCNRTKKQIGETRAANENPPAESLAHTCGTCWRRSVEAGRA